MKLKMNKAFIAAPMIGTIIFLAAVVFVVNLSKGESASATQTAQDAYSNRMSSLMEVYRTDLGGVFRQSLSNSVETLFTRQCWDQFDVSNAKAAVGFNSYDSLTGDCIGVGAYDAGNCYPAGGSSVSQKEYRYASCKEVTGLVGELICSVDPSEVAKYGLPGWISYLADTVYFEGIRFSPANEPVFRILYDPNGPFEPGTYDASTSYADYNKYCSKLFKENLFDCKQFADRDPVYPDNKRCCTEATKWNQECSGPGRSVLPGCEYGTFFLNLTINDPELYPVMPRVEVTDDGGNVIRSGAVADEDFILGINFPLFRYYDSAFNFFNEFVYGGTADYYGGICATESGDCHAVCPNPGCSVFPAANDAAAKQKVYDELKKRLQAACTAVQTPNACDPGQTSSLKAFYCKDAASCDISSTGKGLGWISCCEILSGAAGTEAEDLFSNANEVVQKNCPDTATTQCFVNGGLSKRMLFEESGVYQVHPSQPNRFCWRLNSFTSTDGGSPK